MGASSRAASIRFIFIHVAPPNDVHIAQPGEGWHKGRVAVWETAYCTATAADLPIQSIETVTGADMEPVFAGEIAVEQYPPNVNPKMDKVQ